MQVGDLVRDKVTKAEDTVGVVVDIEKYDDRSIFRGVQVLTNGRICHWSEQRLEVVSASR
jgi:hypothetical protein